MRELQAHRPSWFGMLRLTSMTAPKIWHSISRLNAGLVEETFIFFLGRTIICLSSLIVKTFYAPTNRMFVVRGPPESPYSFFRQGSCIVICCSWSRGHSSLTFISYHYKLDKQPSLLSPPTDPNSIRALLERIQRNYGLIRR